MEKEQDILDKIQNVTDMKSGFETYEFCAKRLRKIYDIGEESVKAKRSTYLPWGQDQPGTTLSDEESNQIKEEVLALSKDVNILE